ncbi:MAG: nicotinate phosphoribosyltransferase [Bacteroidota bacterium]
MTPWIDDARAALVTDLYQLTMVQAYWHEGLTAPATFDLFIRRLPPTRTYFLACGLDRVLRYLETVRFTDEALAYLATLPHFGDDFLAWLADFRFTGSVRAVAEGTPVFPNAPLLEVTAPLPEAQLVESFLINQISVQTMIATKAARVVRAAQGRTVADFGMRRMDGTDATMKGARAMYIAGVEATSNVEAGRVYGIPVTGTMAHSYIEAHEDQGAAFRAFAGLYPGTTVLVDTYDTLRGVRRVIDLVQTESLQIGALRLDSGDLSALAKGARGLLDDAGLTDVRLLASSSLDEYKIMDLLADGAPLDGFGVGTRMGQSQDAPTLDTVYKLAEYDGRGRMKLATNKGTFPGRKQVVRRTDGDGTLAGDTVIRDGEALESGNLDGTLLLREVMRDGERTEAGRESLATIRERAQTLLGRLPARLHRIGDEASVEPYPVAVSAALQAEADRVRAEIEARAGS